MTLDTAIAAMLAVIDPPGDVAMDVEIAMRLGACRHSGAGVGDVAKRLGVGRRCLSRRMFDRGLPPPSKLLAWGKLLDAMLAWTGGATLAEIAWSRGYGAQAEVSNMLRRYSGMWPTEWSGDIGELCEALYDAWVDQRRPKPVEATRGPRGLVIQPRTLAEVDAERSVV